jgi:substrate import-associated zinc metallohydrolase lipoprotein
MRFVKYYFLFLFGLTVLGSCKKEDALNVDDVSGLGGDTWVKTPLDQWLYDSLVVPYNIATKYKWDQFELELNKDLVPPDESKVIPVMSTVERVWINPYVLQGGVEFFKKYCPKLFVLVGSASFNLDGSITLGTAEGGRKIVLYELNDFKNKTMPGYVPADSAIPKQMFHVIHHEFGHILDQNIRRPVEFDAVCKGLYTADWINTNDYAARQDGFVTAYAESSPFEDFVEMISIMLIEGRSGFDNIVNSITGTSSRGTTADEAKARLRQKESLVVDYYKKAWSIDFYTLQTRVRTAIINEIY